MSFLVLCDLKPPPHGLNAAQDLALGQQKKLNIVEGNKEPANMMVITRHAAVGGLLVVQIHPVFLNYNTLLPNCSLHGKSTLFALKFCA